MKKQKKQNYFEVDKISASFLRHWNSLFSESKVLTPAQEYHFQAFRNIEIEDSQIMNEGSYIHERLLEPDAKMGKYEYIFTPHKRNRLNKICDDVSKNPEFIKAISGSAFEAEVFIDDLKSKFDIVNFDKDFICDIKATGSIEWWDKSKQFNPIQAGFYAYIYEKKFKRELKSFYVILVQRVFKKGTNEAEVKFIRISGKWLDSLKQETISLLKKYRDWLKPTEVIYD